MRALTIRQPWAWAIMHAGKDIENRTWRTGLRGPLLIHAGMAKPSIDDVMDFRDCTTGMSPLPPPLPRTDQLVLGALLGVVQIVDCVDRSSSPWFFGPFGFVLREPRLFPQPIPYRGKQGFFDVPDGLISR